MGVGDRLHGNYIDYIYYVSTATQYFGSPNHFDVIFGHDAYFTMCINLHRTENEMHFT